MTLLFCDSFDFYSSLATRGYTAAGGGNGLCSIVGGGRNGTNGVNCGNRTSAIAPLPSSPASLVAGVSVKPTGLADGTQILTFMDGGTGQLEVAFMANGAVRVASGAVLATTGAGVIIVNGSYYLEAKIVIAPAGGGSIIVKLNSQTIVNLAAVTTRQSGVSQATGVMLGGSGANPTVIYDDFTVCDLAGARNNDFLGDVRVQAILPSGAGNYTEWDGLTGAATHWQAQAENPADDDTSYVSDTLAAPGHRDTYALGNLTPATGTVLAVQVDVWARKDDAGARTISPMLRGGAGPVDAIGAAVGLGGAYLYTTQISELDPAGAGWTIATVNGLEAGVKAVS